MAHMMPKIYFLFYWIYLFEFVVTAAIQLMQAKLYKLELIWE